MFIDGFFLFSARPFVPPLQRVWCEQGMKDTKATLYESLFPRTSLWMQRQQPDPLEWNCLPLYPNNCDFTSAAEGRSFCIDLAMQGLRNHLSMSWSELILDCTSCDSHYLDNCLSVVWVCCSCARTSSCFIWTEWAMPRIKWGWQNAEPAVSGCRHTPWCLVSGYFRRTTLYCPSKTSFRKSKINWKNE